MSIRTHRTPASRRSSSSTPSPSCGSPEMPRRGYRLRVKLPYAAEAMPRANAVINGFLASCAFTAQAEARRSPMGSDLFQRTRAHRTGLPYKADEAPGADVEGPRATACRGALWQLHEG